MSNNYLSQILQGQQQRQISGGGKLTSGQVEAAFTGDIAARYQAEEKSAGLALQERQVATGEKAQAAQESESAASLTQQKEQFGQQMAYNQDVLSSQQSAGKLQTGVSAIGAVGEAALAYKVGGKLFGDTAVKTAVTTPAATAAYTGAAAEGTAAAAGTEAALAGSEEAAAATGAAYAGEGAAAGAGAAIGEGVAMEVGADIAGEMTAAAAVSEGASIWATVGEAVVTAAAAWVLCSELVRQGKLESGIVDDEWEYIKARITQREYSGYRAIADPLVKLMQKSQVFTAIIAPFIRAFAYEMASRVNPKIKGSRFGKFILWAGLPLCRLCSPESIRAEVRNG